MKLVRQIVSTTLISSAILITLVFGTILISRFMLDLKELSNQTIRVLAAWNALDRTTNDVLYYRLDSVSRLEQIENSWLESSADLDRSFEILKTNRLLRLLPAEIGEEIEEAWYIWLFSKGKLNESQRIFGEILHGEKAEEVLFELDKTTFFEKLQGLIDRSEDFQERQTYQSFVAQMYVLDITSEGFSQLLESINKKIPGRIDSYIFILLIIVILSFVCVILVSFSSSRRIIGPINRLADAVGRMSEDDYPVEIGQEPTTEDDEDELHIIHNAFNRMAGRIHALYEESLKTEREKQRAQFRALQYQVNPHFLYNTLGSLQMSAAIKGDRTTADNIQALSRFLRNTISMGDRLITLHEELETLDDYVALIQLRYRNRLQYSLEIAPVSRDCFLPALVLQPLVENAVLHGLSAKLNQEASDARLVIRSLIRGNGLVLIVEDNGKGIDQARIPRLLRDDEAGGPGSRSEMRIGLNNTHERLVLLFGPEYGLRVESEPGLFTRIILHLPVVTEESYGEVADS